MSFNVKYGSENLAFSLPPKWKLIAAIKPKEREVITKSEKDVVEKSLKRVKREHRIFNIVKPENRIAIITDDVTRPTPSHLIVPLLLDELNEAGVPNENIKVVVAVGLHPKPSPEEVERKLGKATTDKVEVLIHDPDRDLVYLGKTSQDTPVYINKAVADADIRVGIGNIFPHPGAGYSGGPKIILPGISGRSTIVQNHSLFIDPHSIEGQIDKNPVYQDMREVVEMLGLDFLVNVVMDSNRRVMKAFAGDLEDVHKRGISFFEKIYGAKVPELADITITSSYPFDIDLFQALKAACSASLVTKDDGIIILVSPCYQGIQDEIYQLMQKFCKASTDEIYTATKYGIIENQALGFIYAKIRQMIGRREVILVTDGIPKDKVYKIGFIYAENIEDAISVARKRFEDANVLLSYSGMSSFRLEKQG